jgi:putative ABC transport system ATP-binding protein
MYEAHIKESTAETGHRGEDSALRVPALEAEHLSRAVVGKVLISDISVQLQVGEVLAVVGPSGSGKSSFLRLLNRLDEPTDGTVRLDGQDYRQFAPQELRCRVGMVMQTAYLFPGTVAENVAYGRVSSGKGFLESRLLRSFSA